MIIPLLVAVYFFVDREASKMLSSVDDKEIEMGKLDTNDSTFSMSKFWTPDGSVVTTWGNGNLKDVDLDVISSDHLIITE